MPLLHPKMWAAHLTPEETLRYYAHLICLVLM